MDDATQEEVAPPPTLFELACAGDTEAIRAMYPAKPPKGADEPPNPNGRDDRGRTPLDLAVIWGFVETAEALVQSGTDLDGCGGGGYTALHRAAIWGKLDCAIKLLELGADTTLQTVTAPGAFAETASDVAKRYGNDDIVLAIRDAENKREQERLEKEAAEAAAATKKGKR